MITIKLTDSIKEILEITKYSIPQNGSFSSYKFINHDIHWSDNHGLYIGSNYLMNELEKSILIKMKAADRVAKKEMLNMQNPSAQGFFEII